jgi:hypothetical protein
LHSTNHAILLYPRWNEEKPEIPQYFLNTVKKDIKIDFKTINLRYEDLKSNIETIKSEIKEIFEENSVCET